MATRPGGHKQLVLAVMVVAALLGGCAREAGQVAPAPAIPEGEFGWLAGDWWGTFEGGCADERWSAPVAGTLMGMFRYTKVNKVEFYEFQVIEPGPAGPTLLLRHFKPGLLAWEEKDKPLAFHLVSQGPREAIFEHNDANKPARLTYRRTGGDEMVVTVERPGGAQPRVDEFHYVRVQGSRNPCHIPE
jgi:hypothetical protein